MSITREAFAKGNFTTKAESNNRANHPIIKFLLANPKRAYSGKEIAKAVGLTQSGIRSMLKYLIKSGLVAHKSPYFMAILNNKKKWTKEQLTL